MNPSLVVIAGNRAERRPESSYAAISYFAPLGRGQPVVKLRGLLLSGKVLGSLFVFRPFRHANFEHGTGRKPGAGGFMAVGGHQVGLRP